MQVITLADWAAERRMAYNAAFAKALRGEIPGCKKVGGRWLVFTKAEPAGA